MRPQSIKTRIIRSLEQGGLVTHNDVAEELGMVPRVASAYLCKLRRLGIVRVVGKIPAREGGGRPGNLWELAP